MSSTLDVAAVREPYVHEWFARIASEAPARVAVQCGGVHVSYERLAAQTQTIAANLARVGVRRGDVIGVLASDRVVMLTQLIAILQAGGAFVPLSADLPDGRLRTLLTLADPRWIVAQDDQRARSTALDASAGRQILTVAELCAAVGDRDDAPATDAAPRPQADDLAYVYFTSGSTGTPKAIAGRLGSVDHYIRWEIDAFELGLETRVSQIIHPSFDAFLRDIFTPLCAGGTICIPPDPEIGLGGAPLLAWLETSAVNLVHCVPSLWRTVMREASDPRELRALRHVLLSGEPVFPADVDDWWSVFGDRIRFANLYGPSETTMTKFVHRIVASDRDRRSVPIGRPIPGCSAFILGEDGRECPPGVAGEIYIRTPHRSLGYYRQPELTREVFVSIPLHDDDAARERERDDIAYKTGDLGRMLDDGSFEILKRKDRQIKIRGVRIEPGEIEQTMRASGLLHDAAIVDRQTPEGDLMLCGYVVLREGASVAALRDHLDRELPPTMVPAVLMPLDRLPLTPNGKLDRQALPAPAALTTVTPAASDAAPRSATEELVAGVWREVLGRAAIGRESNFFASGGHSLLATQVMGRLRRIFNAELPLRLLFDAPTVAGLASAISDTVTRSTRAGISTPPLVRIPRTERLPLSYAQQRLWFLEQLIPGQSLYNVPFALEARGALQIDALAQSLTALVARHESLRTTFPSVGGTPVQAIDPPRAVLLPVIDLTALAPRSATRLAEPIASTESIAAADAARVTEQIAASEAARPFDLSRGPLLRACVVRLERERHALLLTLHHIISDGWSIGLLIQELIALYRAACAKEPARLAPLPVQYADYAVWQRQWLEAGELATQLAYWRRQLAGVVPLALPLDTPRPPVASHRGASVPFTIPATLTRALEALSQREGVTLFMTLLAAVQAVLGRVSGQTDVAIGTVVANRTRAETEGLIGFFINQLVLRTDLRSAATGRALLAQVRQTTLDAYAHQDVPFEHVVQELKPERDLSREPLCQVMLILHNMPATAVTLDTLTLTPIPVPERVARMDLTLEIEAEGDSLSGRATFATDLFNAESVSRICERIVRGLEALVADPAASIASWPLLDATERDALVRAWNATDRQWPSAASALELIAAQIARVPDRVAVATREAAITYEALDRYANTLARRLRARGVSADVIVGVGLERSPDLLTALLAVWKAGGAYVPLDPSLPVARLDYMLRDARVHVLITDRASRATWPAGAYAIVETPVRESDADDGGVPGSRDLVAASEAHDDATSVIGCEPGQLAYVIYTSGSTGKPKGVEVPHRALINFLRSMADRPGLSEGDSLLAATTLSFDIAGLELYLPLTVGGRVELATRDEATDGARLLARLPASTMLQATPAMWRMLLAAGWHGTSRLRALCGGESLPDALAAELVARGDEVWNMYGPSETTIWSTVDRVGADAGPVTIGNPIANTTTFVVDDAIDVMPVNAPGELLIGGVGLARGYRGRPDLTAEKFIPDPFSREPGARLYRTGDLARVRADGRLECLGRLDHQVKVRGFRIELGEIEAALRDHPLIADAVVTAGPGPDSVGQRLIAYVVADPSANDALDSTSLRATLAARLPDYMLPNVFVPLSHLPLNANGKVDRRALPSPEDAGIAIGTMTPFVAPETPVEEALAAIWQQVLRVDRLGVRDNFFDRGGHSLLATQVIARMRDTLGIDLPLRALFDAPTIAQLAPIVERSQQHRAPSALRHGELDAVASKSAAWQSAFERSASEPSTSESVTAEPSEIEPALRRVSRDADLPLSHAQQSVWLADQIESEHAVFVMPFAARLRGPLNVPALRASLDDLVARHESLRTVFPATADGPRQHILLPQPIHLLAVDLAALDRLTAPARDAALGTLMALEMRRRFDLVRGPLFRPFLFRLAPDEHVLFLTMHHIICDGWSIAILVEELMALYEAQCERRSAELPPLPVQYADVAVWQRERLSGARLERQMAYWRRQLANLPELHVSRGRSRSDRAGHRDGAVPVMVTAELTQRVKRASDQERVTPFMTLLAAFQVLLGAWTQQEDIPVGTDVANRTRVETEGVIGFFVNQVVLRTSLAGGPTFREVLQRVRTVTLDAYAHQDVPFEQIVQELNPVRDGRRSPLFQVKLVLQNQPMPTRTSGPAGVRLEPMPLAEYSALDLLLMLVDDGSTLTGSLRYDAGCIESAQADELAQVYLQLVEDICDPARRGTPIRTITAHAMNACRERARRQHRSLARMILAGRRRRAGASS